MQILKKLQIILGVFIAFYSLAVSAAQITVPPGAGTLATAIASASNGDTLILLDGNYLGDVTVSKSLHIRADNRQITPMIEGVLTVAGVNIEVTLHGLTFSGVPVVSQASSVRILQNRFLSGIDLSTYTTVDGDGSLVFIGNNIGALIFDNDDAYIAGNQLGALSIASSAWVVGNKISGRISATSSGVVGDGAVVRIIGNRINCPDGSGSCVYLNLPISLVSNNIILDTRRGYSDICIQGNTGEHTVINNTLYDGTYDSDPDWDGLYKIDYSKGNILFGFSSPFASGGTHSNSLCFGGSGNCPAGNGNMNVDPQFVDLVDYRLSPTSPAIDAGPNDVELADLDRSRNDMGAYGGPWSIDQFDIQRDPLNFSPYVYPLFQGGTAFSGGVLNVQAIGVAKLR